MFGTGLEETRTGGHPMKRNRKGFTLIELLIVVAIIGIIVAIAIPNLLNAIQRAKQKRSMADIRSIGTAAETYAIDFNRYPSAAGFTLPSGAFLPGPTIGAGNFAKLVQPTYIKLLPLKDGWANYFLYDQANGNQDYAIASYGKNGVTDGDLTSSNSGPTTDFNADIVFYDGQFVKYPEGAQK
jgi:general secretion pathway protein G